MKRSTPCVYPTSDAIAAQNTIAASLSLEQQPSPQTWQAFFSIALLSIGSIALVLALVFFIAYNWAHMGKIGKFGLVETALIICILSYTLTAYANRFVLAQKLLLLTASIVVGSLLALVGQVYQTGAETWQLFCSWAVLIIPFVFIARLPALWLMFLGLLNLTVMQYIGSSHDFFSSPSNTFGIISIVLGLLNSMALLGWLFFYDGPRNSQAPDINTTYHYHWSTYVVGIVTAICATILGIYGILEDFEGSTSLVAFALWSAILLFYYWRFYKITHALLLLTCFCASIITVVMTFNIKYLGMGDGLSFLFLNALLLIGMSSAAVTWLLKRHKQHSALIDSSVQTGHNDAATLPSYPTYPSYPHDQQASLSHDEAATPWYIQVFLAISGLISGLLVIGFILLFIFNMQDKNAFFIMGSILLGISIAMFYKSTNSKHAFIGSLALSFSLAGQAFIAYALFVTIDDLPDVIAALILFELSLAVLVPNFLHRILCSLMAFGCMTWLFSYFQAPELAAGFLALNAAVFGLQRQEFLGYLVSSPSTTSINADVKPHFAPNLNKQARVSQIFRALAFSSALMLLVISVIFISAQSKSYLIGIDVEFHYYYPLAQGALIAASLYAAYIILRRYGMTLFSHIGIICMSSVLLLGMASLYVSGLLATSLVIVIGVANQQRPMMILGIISLVGYIFWYYYQLDTSLLLKSGSMLVVGVLLLIMRWVMTVYFVKPSKPLLNEDRRLL